MIRDAVLAGIGTDRSVTSESISYSAAAMDVLWADFQNLIDFGPPLKSDWDYFESVNEGVAVLNERLLNASFDCPNQKWVLIGYSQGSMVISQVVRLFQDPALYAGVLLLSNPSRNSTDKQSNFGTAKTGNGLNFWVPGDLGYFAMPESLAPVTVDFCDAQDLVCDSTHTFEGILLPAVDGNLWDPPRGIPGAFDRGNAIHIAYSKERLTPFAQPAIERALSFAVPTQVTRTLLVCGATGVVSGSATIKRLNPAGNRSQKWSLNRTILSGALTGAIFTDHGFTKGNYWLSIDDEGNLTGVLPASKSELDVTVTTGLDRGRTIRLIVRVITSGSCGGVDGYVTDSDGEPIEGIEVWLEETADGWDGVSDRRLAMNRTDTNGYFSINGSYSGRFLLFFTDGQAAQTYQEGTAEGYLDYFDQYFSTGATGANSDQPDAGTIVHLGGSITRSDQALRQSSSLAMQMFDAKTNKPLKGIEAWSSYWSASTNADGSLWHAGRLSYFGCMSIYDPERVYVPLGKYYLGWWGEGIIRMYRGSSISGMVTDAAGKPVANAMVTYTRDDLPDWAIYDFGGGAGCYNNLGLSESGQARTDANGHYRVGSLYGGENYVVTTAFNNAYVRSKPFSLTTAYDGFTDVTVDLRDIQLILTSATPTIQGVPRVGLILKAMAGSWTADTAFSYQWNVAGQAVSGATKSTFTPRSSDIGKTVTVRVTGTKPGYTSVTTTSKATATVAVPKPPSQSVKPDRIFGDDRYSTAVAVSKAGFAGTAPIVYLATGQDYPDALAAAPAAAKRGGPLLLTTSKSLPAVVKTEVRRLKPAEIVIVGGKGAVSEAVEKELKKLAGTVTRLGGADRFATSRLVIKNAFSTADTMYLATGLDFPDALSASAAGGAFGAPVALVDGRKGKKLDANTAALLKSMKVKNTFIAGGTGVMNADIENTLKKTTTVERLSGENRYETSRAVNKAAFPTANRTFLATGLQFPDALAGAALAGAQGAPLYVVQTKCIPGGILDDIDASGTKRVTLIGGTGALSAAVEKFTRC